MATETWKQRDFRRNKIIEDAVGAADRIILRGSFGSEEETNYLTGEVAKKFVEKAMMPFGAKMLKKDIEDDS